MKAVIQRVLWAEVQTDDRIVGRIGRGLLVYTAVGPGDTSRDATDLAKKIVHLRIFQDEHGKMNLSVRDVRGGILAVSNFAPAGRHAQRPPAGVRRGGAGGASAAAPRRVRRGAEGGDGAGGVRNLRREHDRAERGRGPGERYRGHAARDQGQRRAGPWRRTTRSDILTFSNPSDG